MVIFKLMRQVSFVSGIIWVDLDFVRTFEKTMSAKIMEKRCQTTFHNVILHTHEFGTQDF